MNKTKKTQNLYDVVILGSGPTGLYGGFYAGLKCLNTLIIEINSTYGGAPARLYPEKPLFDIPGCVNITGAQLVNNMYKQLQSMSHWEIIYNTEITKIIKHSNSENNIYYDLIDKNNNIYKAKNIIFATGYGAFEFINFEQDVEIINNPKISFYINKLEYYKNKNVIICGGGDSAVDIANILKSIAKSTSLIHRRYEFRAKQANVEKLKNDINLHLNKTVYKLDHNKIYLYDNDSKNKYCLNFDEILVMFGTRMIPSNIDLPNLYNKIHKIEINPLTLESINYKNIYACGLSNNLKNEQTIVTGISDIIKVIAHIHQILKK